MGRHHQKQRRGSGIMEERLEAKYGLPEKVYFCKKCVMSNQRPASTPEFKHTIESKKVTLHIDEEGVCDACRFAEQKEKIDWEAKERELLRLLGRYRRNDGYYDCVVPGSGGKDSALAARQAGNDRQPARGPRGAGE